jgi:hypothetical protein
MKIRRKIALLASTAFVLQGLMAQLPAKAEDDLAAFVFWRVPLGGPEQDAASSTVGFSLLEADNVWLATSGKGTSDVFVPPALVDLRFSTDDAVLPSLSFSGVDVGMAFDDGLYAGPGPAPHLGEWILIGAGTALGGLTICAAAGCFDGDNDDDVAAEGGEAPA